MCHKIDDSLQIAAILFGKKKKEQKLYIYNYLFIRNRFNYSYKYFLEKCMFKSATFFAMHQNLRA